MTTLNERMLVLEKFGTKKLLEDLKTTTDNLYSLLAIEQRFKRDNVGWLAPAGQDCTEVKGILAGLTPEGKTVAEREAWLQRARKNTPELAAAIARQGDVLLQRDDHALNVEMAREKLSNIRAVLALREAQINFLAGAR